MREIIKNKHFVSSQAKTYKCDICNDVGYVRYNRDGNSFAKKCQCKLKEEALSRMSKSGLNIADLQVGFDGFKTFNNAELIDAKRKSIQYCQEYSQIIKQRSNSILLYGASGRGKTRIGCTIASELMNQYNVIVTYKEYRKVATHLKQNVTVHSEYYRVMNEMINADLLFIDDLLKGKTTEFDVNILYEIINHRYNNRLPIIISTERTIQELLQFDEAIGGRIIEMCKGYLISFSANIPNYRLRTT